MKISIIGAGRVGSATAFSIIHSVKKVKEITLVDLKENLVKGESLDLSHAAYAMGKKVDVIGLKDPQPADLTIITAGVAGGPGIPRRELITDNHEIIKSIIQKLDTKMILMVTNPVDVLTYFAWKDSGLPREKVFGQGGVLDTGRLNYVGLEGEVYGEHGDKNTLTEEQKKAVHETYHNVMKWKGGTAYGPAAATARMVKAIIENTEEVMPCSCILQGEYGITDVAMGVPAKITSNGVEVVEKELDKEKLMEAAEDIKQFIR